MKIALHDCAGDVTGSAYYLQSVISDNLIDFGIFQGDRSLEFHDHICHQLISLPLMQ
jgi:hypothetical protein